MRYNRIDLPQTYRNLIDAEFTNDYTMGYTHESGFRAGTCTSFYFYDISLEIQQPIRIYPFAIHDYALTSFKSSDDILKHIGALHKEVKKVNGDLVTVFSNELLGETLFKVDWKELYRNTLRNYSN